MGLKKITRLEYIEALESGKYTQTRGALYDNDTGEDCFCGLGIIYELKGYEKLPDWWAAEDTPDNLLSGFLIPEDEADQSTAGFTTASIRQELDMTIEQACTVYKMNDRDRADFNQIAAYLRKEWNLLKDDKTNT